MRVIGLLLLFALAACEDQVPPAATPAAVPRPPAGPPTYIGNWAAEPALCGKAFWSIIPGALLTASDQRCALAPMQATATGWAGQARCEGRAAELVELNTTRSDPPTLVVSGGPWTTPVRLVKCPIAPGADPETMADPHQPLEAARAIDAAIARPDPGVTVVDVRNNALLTRIWRRDGQIIKILAPLVGGEHAGAERSYYFRPGEDLPFLVWGPTGAYAFFRGRLVTTFTREGEVVPELSTREESQQERGLIQQARNIRAVAENLEPSAAAVGASK